MSSDESPAVEIRKNVLALRAALSNEDVVEKSAEVVARFLESVSFAPDQWSGLKIALYQAMPGEIDLHELEQDLLARGAKVCFPRVVNLNSREMDFVEIASPQSLNDPDWSTGPLGILQPTRDLPAMEPASIDLLIVPGVAFGRQGERIGMGAGFYDRFLARISDHDNVKVGLAFDFQLFDSLEQAPWDQQVDWIVTETHVGLNDRAEGWLQKATELQDK